jgi:hypothetical protein
MISLAMPYCEPRQFSRSEDDLKRPKVGWKKPDPGD